jgi:argininosuccinate lyase
MEQYNASLPYDRLFYAEDIAGSIAFARANHNNGILTKDEFAAIEKGLAQVKEEWASNRHPYRQRAQAERDHRKGHWWEAAHGPKQERASRD